MSEKNRTEQYKYTFTAICGRPPYNTVELARFLNLLHRFGIDKPLTRLDNPSIDELRHDDIRRSE